jgi:hypothetical protein
MMSPVNCHSHEMQHMSTYMRLREEVNIDSDVKSRKFEIKERGPWASESKIQRDVYMFLQIYRS